MALDQNLDLALKNLQTGFAQSEQNLSDASNKLTQTAQPNQELPDVGILTGARDSVANLLGYNANTGKYDAG